MALVVCHSKEFPIVMDGCDIRSPLVKSSDIHKIHFKCRFKMTMFFEFSITNACLLTLLTSIVIYVGFLIFVTRRYGHLPTTGKRSYLFGHVPMWMEVARGSNCEPTEGTNKPTSN